jgi:hypothetical protein
MTPAPQHSDRSNTDNPESVTLRTPKWRVVFGIDERGYVCGPIRFLPPDAERSRQGYLELKRGSKYPFDRSEIVWPEPQWPVDDDGRGLSVMEVKGAQYLEREQFIIAVQVRQFLASSTHHAIVTRFAA